MFNKQRDSDRSLVLDALFHFVNIRNLAVCWRRTFRAYDVKTM